MSKGDGHGIGHSLESFLRRFDEICTEHIKAKRAKAFALILYDFGNQDLRRILKDQGSFAILDRLAGSILNVFYLHTGSSEGIKRFNELLLAKLDVQEKATLPCVVFFKVGGDGVCDIVVAQLDNANLIHGFRELFGVLEDYLKGADIRVVYKQDQFGG
jgi:hypothetical protein